MNWLRRRGVLPDPPAPPAPPERVERPSLGVAMFFAEISADRQHSILDLGTATRSSLHVYGSLARWVRFGDLLSIASSGEEVEAALATITPHPQQPYDLLLAWNLLDRVAPDLRLRVVERLIEVSAAEARLHLLVEMPGEGPRRPLRFGLEGRDRLWYEPAGTSVHSFPPLLPAEVERMIEPFQVARAFTTQAGFREYVAFRHG